MSANTRKISILLPDLRVGGAELLHVTLAREWLACGIAVEFVLVKARGTLLGNLPDGATVFDLNADRIRDAFLPLVRYLRSTPPDALLAAMWPLTVLAPLAAIVSGFRGRVAVSEHSPLHLAYKDRGFLLRAALRLSTAIGYRASSSRIGVSNGVAAGMAQSSWLPLSRIRVIYNAAARGAGERDWAVPHQLDGSSGPVVLSVGTLKAVKRHDLMLRSFAKLPRDLGAALCILGEGPERAHLEALADSLGIARQVIFPGYVDEPAPWYAHADLFVLCSDYEGFGNVLVEALEHGVPVVSTDCPVGPREVLANGRFGVLVPVDNVDALAAAMLVALRSPVDPAPLKARALEFSPAMIADMYLDELLPTGIGGLPRGDVL